MKSTAVLLFTILVLPRFGTAQQLMEWDLVWEDDFDGTSLDTTKWTAIIGDGCPELCGFGNNELQYYTGRPENLKQENGTLKIIADDERIKNRGFSSAKLITQNKGDWKYGRIEVRARLPYGTGTWPAIWMLPSLESRRWPLDGEIDIMEHVGYNQGVVYGTIHTQKYNHMRGTHISDSIYIKDASTEFHTYRLVWDEQKMVWSVDDKEYLTLLKEKEDYEAWPFDQEYHLIINLAVGGNWGGKKGVDPSIWPQSFEIDYVRVYQRTESPENISN